MNKILFKLIEGKGKFFLMRDMMPIFNYAFHIQEREEDAIKNGEIVNPEVLPEYLKDSMLIDGEPLLLPEGIGFEEVSNQSKCNYCKLDCLQNLKGRPCKAPKAIRLLPEKPVQRDDQVTITTNKSGLEKAFDLARKEGFNEALEEVNELITNILSKESYKDDYREEILKLKK